MTKCPRRERSTTSQRHLAPAKSRIRALAKSRSMSQREREEPIVVVQQCILYHSSLLAGRDQALPGHVGETLSSSGDSAELVLLLRTNVVALSVLASVRKPLPIPYVSGTLPDPRTFPVSTRGAGVGGGGGGGGGAGRALRRIHPTTHNTHP